MPNWFYTNDFGLEEGPVSDAELKKLVERQIIRPDTPLKTESGKTGKAGQLRGLFPAAPAPPPPPQSIPEPSPFLSATEIVAMQTEQVSNYPPPKSRAARSSHAASQVFGWMKSHIKTTITIGLLLATLVSWLFGLMFNENLEGKWEIVGNNPLGATTTIELLQDGTGFIDGAPITWETEWKRVGRRSYRNNLHFNSTTGDHVMCEYKIFGSTLTLIYAEGKINYKKQQGETFGNAETAKDKGNPTAAVKGKSDPVVEKDVRDVFARFKTAVRNRNGKEAAECISTGSINWYADTLEGIKKWDKTKIINDTSPFRQIFILTARNTVPKDTLLAMKDSKELFIYLFEHVRGFNFDTFAPGNIEMVFQRNNAHLVGTIMRDKGGTTNGFDFIRVPAEGKWKIELLNLMPQLDKALKEIAKQQKLSTEQLILVSLEQRLGRKPDDSIWGPDFTSAKREQNIEVPAEVPRGIAVEVNQRAADSDAEKEIRKLFARYKTAIQNKNAKAAAECLSNNAIRWYAFILRGAKEFDKGTLQSRNRVSLLERYMILETRHRMPKETLLAMKEGTELFIYSLENDFLGSNLITQYDIKGKILKKEMFNEVRDDLMDAFIVSNNKTAMISFALSPEGQWKIDSAPPLASVITQALIDRAPNKGPVAPTARGRIGIVLDFPDESVISDLEQRSGKKTDASIWIPLQPPKNNLPGSLEWLEEERRAQQQRDAEASELYKQQLRDSEIRGQELQQTEAWKEAQEKRMQEAMKASKEAHEKRVQEMKEAHEKRMQEAKEAREKRAQERQQRMQRQMPTLPPPPVPSVPPHFPPPRAN